MWVQKNTAARHTQVSLIRPAVFFCTHMVGTQPSGLRCWRAGWPAPGHHLHPGGQSLQGPNELPGGGSIPARTGNGLIGLEPLGDARLPLHQCPTAKMTQG